MSEKYLWKKKASKLSFKIARQQAFQARKEAAAAASTPSTTPVAQPKASLKTRLQPGVAQFCYFNSFLTKFKMLLLTSTSITPRHLYNNRKKATAKGYLPTNAQLIVKE